MRVVLVAVLGCLVLLPTPALARWFGTPCAKGADGRCVQIPCAPFLDQIRALANARQKADDPGCPDHPEASRRADEQQQTVDGWPRTTTECLRQAVAIMRTVASIDVQRSYRNDAGIAFAIVRYTNNTQATVRTATITCSAIHDDHVVATGKATVSGPVPDKETRDLPVKIALAGAPFACTRCTLTDETTR